MSKPVTIERVTSPATTSEAAKSTGRAVRGGWALLASGDRLTRREFHRRYARCPEGVKAELVEGTVYMPSPARVDHGVPHADVLLWLGHYRIGHPEVMVCSEGTVMLDDENEVQPDAFARLEPDMDGSSEVKKGYVTGPPELVVEVAASSVSIDMHQKREAYRRNGVREYVVWRVYDHALDWWSLEGGDYVSIEPDSDGVYHSRVFPGLCLDAPALLAGDLAAVVRRLDESARRLALTTTPAP